jgi:hypothetical protein
MPACARRLTEPVDAQRHLATVVAITPATLALASSTNAC